MWDIVAHMPCHTDEKTPVSGLYRLWPYRGLGFGFNFGLVDPLRHASSMGKRGIVFE